MQQTSPTAYNLHHHLNSTQERRWKLRSWKWIITASHSQHKQQAYTKRINLIETRFRMSNPALCACTNIRCTKQKWLNRNLIAFKVQTETKCMNHVHALWEPKCVWIQNLGRFCGNSYLHKISVKLNVIWIVHAGRFFEFHPHSQMCCAKIYTNSLKKDEKKVFFAYFGNAL